MADRGSVAHLGRMEQVPLISRPPVFLDRDGTLIVESEYLRDPEQVRLEAGAIDALAMLRRGGYPLIVISNQSGIGRGLFEYSDARCVNARVADILRLGGIDVLAWYICPHTPQDGCDCRKPLPGMALAAGRDWHMSLEGSYVIGDKRSDLELADAIGGTGILVLTGYGGAHAEWARAGGRPVFEGLPGAAGYILDPARRQRKP